MVIENQNSDSQIKVFYGKQVDMSAVTLLLDNAQLTVHPSDVEHAKAMLNEHNLLDMFERKNFRSKYWDRNQKDPGALISDKSMVLAVASAGPTKSELSEAINRAFWARDDLFAQYNNWKGISLGQSILTPSNDGFELDIRCAKEQIKEELEGFDFDFQEADIIDAVFKKLTSPSDFKVNMAKESLKTVVELKDFFHHIKEAAKLVQEQAPVNKDDIKAVEIAKSISAIDPNSDLYEIQESLMRNSRDLKRLNVSEGFKGIVRTILDLMWGICKLIGRGLNYMIQQIRSNRLSQSGDDHSVNSEKNSPKNN